MESISHITAQTLYDCHRVFYAPSNMVLCVEGCVDPETVARIAEEELPKERAEIPTADFGEKESMLPRERLCRVQGRSPHRSFSSAQSSTVPGTARPR